MNIHPKTSAAGLGASVGVIVATLIANLGLHVSTEAATSIGAAVTGLLSLAGAYFAPSPEQTPPAPAAPPQP